MHVVQVVLQWPQLFGSLSKSTQAPLQHVAAPESHATPQPPQFALSVVVSAQYGGAPPSQYVWPLMQLDTH